MLAALVDEAEFDNLPRLCQALQAELLQSRTQQQHEYKYILTYAQYASHAGWQQSLANLQQFHEQGWEFWQSSLAAG